MRTENHYLRACCVLLAVTALVVVSGCPATTGGGAAGPAASGSQLPGGPACERSLVGDLKTVNDRLSRGHPEEALVYVNAIKDCRGNLDSLEFLEVASEVYEELGSLNRAWWALNRATQVVASGSAEQSRVAARVLSFEASYVRLKTSGAGSIAPDINYLGAVLDDATYELLKQVSANRGVDLGQASWGFWLFPGRYEIMGRRHSLGGGQTLDLTKSESH